MYDWFLDFKGNQLKQQPNISKLAIRFYISIKRFHAQLYYIPTYITYISPSHHTRFKNFNPPPRKNNPPKSRILMPKIKVSTAPKHCSPITSRNHCIQFDKPCVVCKNKWAKKSKPPRKKSQRCKVTPAWNNAYEFAVMMHASSADKSRRGGGGGVGQGFFAPGACNTAPARAPRESRETCTPRARAISYRALPPPFFPFFPFLPSSSSMEEKMSGARWW